PGHTGGMVQDLAHGHGLLAVGAELRPQLGDRGVVGEPAALGELVGDGGGRALDDRGAVEHGARVDRAGGVRVGAPRDGADHPLAVAVDGDLEPALGSGPDQLVDGLLHILLDVAHAPTPSLTDTPDTYDRAVTGNSAVGRR